MAKEKKLRIYSNLSGFNIYYVIMQHYGARVPDNFVITDIRENNETNLHASVVYRSSEPMPETKAAWFAEIIQNPVSNSLFQWPIDLIEIKRATEYVVCLVYAYEKSVLLTVTSIIPVIFVSTRICVGYRWALLICYFAYVLISVIKIGPRALDDKYAAEKQ